VSGTAGALDAALGAGAVALVAAAAILAGGRLRGLLAAPAEDRLYRLALALAAGLVTLYAGLLVLDAVGIPWGPASVVLTLAAAALAAGLASRRAPAVPEAGRLRPGWGDGIAALCLAALALAALQMWIVNPDFIYHWGVKGWKFYLAGGIDFDFLTGPGSEPRHIDYPWLVPSLFAATAAVAGGFREAGMMLWTALFFAALLASAREVLRRAEVSPFASQSTLAIVGASSAAFGIGFLTAGGADWILALAPLLAWPAFLREPDRTADLTVGIAAALAAGAKIEGLPMAAFLLGLHLLRRGPGRLKALPVLLTPSILVVAPWLAQGFRHGLFTDPHRGPFDLAHAAAIVPALWSALRVPEWHEAPAALLLLPALLFLRSTRPAAALVGLQLLVYLYVYFAAPAAIAQDLDYYVRSNFSRLASHLVPTLLVACGIAFDRWLGGRQAAT
jgi:hypothetical protein